MILDELVLHNFGVYRGQHRTVLTPPPDRPIILFGALNGSGKTTFMEGMQLALYGRATASRGRHAYPEYLARSVNRYVSPGEGAGVELAFRYWTDGSLQPIRLKRTWHQSGKAVKETFEVWRNDVLDAVATERWTEFVEDIIPNQIAHLFFFDGEKIEGLADPKQSAALLRVGLHSLLGLDLVDHLVKSLGIVERRSKVAGLDAPDRSALELLDEEIVALDKQRISLGERIAEANSHIDQRVNEISRVDKQLERSGGHLLGRRKEIESEYERFKREREQICGELLMAAAGDAPLLLLGSLMAELEESMASSFKGASDRQIGALIERRDSEILKKLSEIGVRAAHVETVRKYLANTRAATKGNGSTVLPINLTPEELITKSEARVVRELVARLLERLGKLDEEIAACERNLGAIPEEDTVRGSLEALRLAQQEAEHLRIRKTILEEEQGKITLELSRKDSQRRAKLEKVADFQLATATAQRIVQHSTRARATLGRYREDIAQRHMVRLEKLITECFGKLHRKKSLKNAISIDRESYELRLTEDQGHSIEASDLSAGERQLLAISVLWALAQASGRRLPTVIDTPLGRLDGPHRHFLVDNYFPYASHQVILFSTDEEVTPAYHRRLAPAIGREYSIVFDEAKRKSVILDGYFKEAALAA
jgi:DNA sulfur modification protein DndD